MFDSALQDWRPGKVKIFGWPWHGRLDLPKTNGAFAPRVTLPNGVTFTLPISPLVPTGMHQSGSLVRFRDPRAVDPARTPAQLAADAVKGVEWRAEALYSPRDGIIYGKANFGGATSQASWVYHDGVTNWTANLSSQSVRLRPMLRVSRHNQNYLNNEEVSIPLSFPDGPLEALTGTITSVVFDATPTGDRAIVGRFSSDVNQRPPSNFINTTTGGLGYCTTVMDFFEVTLTNVAGVRTAEIRSVKNVAQTAGSVVTGGIPQVTGSAIETRVEFTKGDPVDQEGPDESYYWNGVTVTSTVETAPYATVYGLATPQVGSYSLSDGYTGRTVAMYYRDELSKASVTVSCLTVENYTGSDISYSAPEATCVVVGPYDPLGSYSAVTEEGALTITGSVTKNWQQTTTLKLSNDGAEISSASLVVDVSESATFSTAFSVGKTVSFESGNHTHDNTTGYVATAGSEFSSDSSSATVNYSGGDLYNGVSISQPIRPSISGAWLTVQAAWAASGNGPEFVLGPLRYCAQMPAGCIFKNAVAGAVTPVITYRIGPGSLPYTGGSFGGSKSGTGKITEIFGSYNPVTQQFIRDASNPVSWV